MAQGQKCGTVWQWLLGSISIWGMKYLILIFRCSGITRQSGVKSSVPRHIMPQNSADSGERGSRNGERSTLSQSSQVPSAYSTVCEI